MSTFSLTKLCTSHITQDNRAWLLLCLETTGEQAARTTVLQNNTGQMNPGMHLDFKIPTRSCKGPLRAFIVLVSVCFIRSVSPFMTDSESRTSDEAGIYGVVYCISQCLELFILYFNCTRLLNL